MIELSLKSKIIAMDSKMSEKFNSACIVLFANSTVALLMNIGVEFVHKTSFVVSAWKWSFASEMNSNMIFQICCMRSFCTNYIGKGEDCPLRSIKLVHFYLLSTHLKRKKFSHQKMIELCLFHIRIAHAKHIE